VSAQGIDRSSGTPLYRQLQELLRARIADGTYKPGQPIPTEQRLAHDFELSRVTVRNALSHLVAEGLVVKRPGKGTYVAPLVVEERQHLLRGFAEVMAQQPNQRMDVLGIEIVKAAGALGRNLALPDGDEVVRVHRRHTIQGEPIGLAIVHLPYRLGRLFTTDDFAHQPVYTLIEEKTAERVIGATQRVSAIAAEGRTAELLAVAEGTPLLLVRRVTRGSQGVPLEYIELYYPPGRHELVMELRRSETVAP
jgi:GntR family transcriptional regulator